MFIITFHYFRTTLQQCFILVNVRRKGWEGEGKGLQKEISKLKKSFKRHPLLLVMTNNISFVKHSLLSPPEMNGNFYSFETSLTKWQCFSVMTASDGNENKVFGVFPKITKKAVNKCNI